MCEGAVTALESLGYQVSTAEDGEDALKPFKQHSNSIYRVITDIGATVMVDKKLFRRLKENCPNMKIELLTGDFLGRSEKLVEQNRMARVQKPADIEEPAQIVQSCNVEKLVL